MITDHPYAFTIWITITEERKKNCLVFTQTNVQNIFWCDDCTLFIFLFTFLISIRFLFLLLCWLRTNTSFESWISNSSIKCSIWITVKFELFVKSCKTWRHLIYSPTIIITELSSGAFTCWNFQQFSSNVFCIKKQLKFHSK